MESGREWEEMESGREWERVGECERVWGDGEWEEMESVREWEEMESGRGRRAYSGLSMMVPSLASSRKSRPFCISFPSSASSRS